MAEPRYLDRPFILLVCAMLCSGCGSSPSPRIGIVLDHDGQRGAMLAAADINAAGGIDGRRLELRVLQGLSSTHAPVALTAAESLSSDPTVLAVVGHSNSSASLAAAQVYNAQHVVQIAPTTTAPLYSDAGPYSFRMVASDVQQGVYLADLVLEGSAAPRVALLYVNDDYGRGLRGTVAKRLAARGVRPVYEAPFADGDRFTDLDDVARAIARSHPDLLVWLGRSPELLLLLPRLRALEPRIRILAGDGFGGPNLGLDSAGVLRGVRYVRLLDLEHPTPAVRRLRERYTQTWREEPTDQFILSYEAVQLVAEAIRVAGPSRESVRQYLAELGPRRRPFVGVAGPVVFDEHGDPPAAYYLAEVGADRSFAVRVARNTIRGGTP